MQASQKEHKYGENMSFVSQRNISLALNTSQNMAQAKQNQKSLNNTAG